MLRGSINFVVLLAETPMTVGGGGGVIEIHKYTHRKFIVFGKYDFVPKSMFIAYLAETSLH